MYSSNWLYTEDRMNLREMCLSALLREYGSDIKGDGTPICSTRSLYECAHDWVSQGNPMPNGILEFYENNYKGKI